MVDQQRSLQSRTCNSLWGCKVPRVTSKQLKAFLTLANVNVHEPTIRRTLSNHGVHGRVEEESTVLQKENCLLKIMWTSQWTIEKGLMDGWNQNRTYWFKWEAIMFREKNTLHSSLRILSHLWNMVVVVSWLGPVLLHLGLPSLMEQWILNHTANSKGKRQDICLRTDLKRTWVMQQDNNPKHESFYQRMVKEEQS